MKIELLRNVSIAGFSYQAGRILDLAAADAGILLRIGKAKLLQLESEKSESIETATAESTPALIGQKRGRFRKHT